MTSCRREVEKLVTAFHGGIERWQRGCSEVKLRAELVEPFWAALGWDVRNRARRSIADREVVYEPSILGPGAPDYSFRVDGHRKLFVDTETPSRGAHRHHNPALVARRYAWSSQLPISVLTDFETLIIYDCRVAPRPTDRSSVGQLRVFRYTAYLDDWDTLCGLLSRDAVAGGALDVFAGALPVSRRAVAVERALADEIEAWRQAMAEPIAIANGHLTESTLNAVLHDLISGVLFLGLGEARGLPGSCRLDALATGEDVYARLLDALAVAGCPADPRTSDERVCLTPDLVVDDAPLSGLLSRLAAPSAPYELGVLPLEIIGDVHERSLGPAVRKAGGVYYTPRTIVRAIVERTLGRLCQGKAPAQLGSVRVVDPACGTGAFLLFAYDYLLKLHLARYVAELQATLRVPVAPAAETEQDVAAIYEGRGGHWYLSGAEKRRILLANIFGLDIDKNAVEITKRGLLLAAAADDGDGAAGGGRSGRAPLDLRDNIKCGNALVASDFDTRSVDPTEAATVNAFDWYDRARGFGRVMDAGGFDCVLGNPPWGATFSKARLAYHRERHRDVIVRMIDSFMFFVDRGIELVAAGGRLGMLVPDVLLYQADNHRLRAKLLARGHVSDVINLGDVYKHVARPAAIVCWHRRTPGPGDEVRVADLAGDPLPLKSTRLQAKSPVQTILQDELRMLPGQIFVTRSPEHHALWNEIQAADPTPLRALVDGDGIQRGVSPDLKAAFVVGRAEADSLGLEGAYLRRVVTGAQQVKRHSIACGDLRLIYTCRRDDFSKLPRICAHIDRFEAMITCPEVRDGKHPRYALHRPRSTRIFVKPAKLVGVITADRPIVALDQRRMFATDGLYVFGLRAGVDPDVIAGVLNSSLLAFLYRVLNFEAGRVMPQVKPKILGELPIRLGPEELCRAIGAEARGLRQVLVDTAAAGGTAADRARLQATADRKIDALVYALYGLSPSKIELVEAALDRASASDQIAT